MRENLDKNRIDTDRLVRLLSRPIGELFDLHLRLLPPALHRAGPGLVQVLLAAKLQALAEKKGEDAAKEVKNDVQMAAGCALCMVKGYIWIFKNMIMPLRLLCDW
eukprot:CAMPEP_0206611804 /NCGR_PEP_ID=MMETSP0325_2-20121206/55543_1 /ASSEMBLY_ACC=CAM_ASM_000347 /TAXON_ID=2866 /ORGANISM="Crypthecodinium cohnii, Strain Seligo" /LENGTH=104 /DNA_ID=CAMNT_0054131237 /DNA_START=93 /DNA_END=407 /DNA_ORIENTATION=+